MTYSIGEKVAVRQAFGPAFADFAQQDEKAVVVTADLGGSVNLKDFWDAYPQRYFNCGVAEQDMIGLCAGLAITGFNPFAVTFGSFLGRAMDHVRQSIGHNKLKVNVVGSHGGVSNAQDGPSAHALEDIAMFRAVPDMAVVVPSDPNQIPQALTQIGEWPTATYFRLYREPLPVFTPPDTPFQIGKAIVRKTGNDVTLVACGPHVGLCLDWVQNFDLDVEIVESHTIKPIDVETIVASASKTGAVITVEDHSIYGGLGSAVAEVLGEHLPTPLERVGMHSYARTGKYMELIDAVGLGQDAVKSALKKVVERKK